MKFSVNKDNILKALVTADSIINPRTPLSILLNIYLEVHNDGQAIIQSYNGDHGVKVEVNVEVEEAGKISLPSKKLLEVIRNTPGDQIQFEQSPGQFEMIIRAVGKKSPTYRLHGVSGDTYPTFKECNWSSYLKLDQAILRELITSTEFAVSNDMAQAAFTGTFATASTDDSISFVTTDGKRLAVITKMIEEKQGDIPTDIIIPQRIMKTLNDTLTQGEVLFSVQEGQAYFKVDSIYIFTNLVEGKFPNYRDVIPSESTSSFLVDASALSASLQRVAIMSDNESGRIKLEVQGSELTISGSTVQGDSSDSIEIDRTEDAEIPTVAVNHKALTDFLRILQGKQVLVSINSAGSPILLRPAGEDYYEYITMPMKI